MTFILFLAVLLLDFSARAQEGAQPICGAVVSDIPFTINGSISTDAAGEKNGTPIRHKKTFKLKQGERLKICSSGPFYEGGRLELTLKTIAPVFSCKTKIDGDVILSVKPIDGGGYVYSADCR